MSKKRVRRSHSDVKLVSKHSQRSSCRSPSPEHFDVSVPLSSLISSHETLAAAAVSFVGWKNVKSMLPPCLQGRSRNDVVLLIADELDCMSKRRISHILQGEVAPSDSSSSEVSREDSGSYEDAERQCIFTEPCDQVSSYSADFTASLISRPSNLEANNIDAVRENCSDIELVEELDEDVDNLPDVSRT